jgi:protein-disulfide isomerase
VSVAIVSVGRRNRLATFMMGAKFKSVVSKGKVAILAAAAVVSICFVGLKILGNASSVKLAEVNGQPIYAADLERTAGKQLSEERQRLYELQKQKLDEYVTALLLTGEARRRGISIEALLREEVHSKIMPVEDSEIEAFYRSNAAALKPDLSETREQIRSLLMNKRIEAQTALYFKSLGSAADIRTYLQPPQPYRAHISTEGAPYKGPDSARVTIISFEDYECPFCKEAQPVLARLLSRYAGQIKVVHKDAPLDAVHPRARLAAEAARCADRQGKFWAFHDFLYAHAPQPMDDHFKRFATKSGIELKAFTRCLDSRETEDLVRRDSVEAAQLQISGTPTFFVNGREIGGSAPLKTLEQIVEEELMLL